MTRFVTALACLLILEAAPASAQSLASNHTPVVEVAGGWAGFVDDFVEDHRLGGLGARVYLTPRLSVGPEVQYFVGPGSDRDLIVTGNLVIDALPSTAAKPRRNSPYVVVGAGRYRHTQRVGTGTYSHSEGGFTLGVGTRAWLTERIFVAGDARVGWELHARLAATVGLALK